LLGWLGVEHGIVELRRELLRHDDPNALGWASASAGAGSLIASSVIPP
jgi:hypothetical protein